ncbi:MAG: FAD-binding oxidoreductase [Proteobacteria bacterium]|nr:FAD-binding oxidoreductase [Pseudomonadota bacterium]
MTKSADVIVVGGGMMGAAIGYGTARCGARTVVLDEGDLAFRAAKANFGNVMVQGKGLGRNAYHRWTRLSALRWAELAQMLKEDASVDVDLVPSGTMRPALSDEEMTSFIGENTRLAQELGDGSYTFDIVDRRQLANVLPGLGREVVGAIFTAYDSMLTPLYALRAFHGGLARHGGVYRAESKVTRIIREESSFTVETASGKVRAAQVVIAAGLGGPALALQVGLKLPLAAERGQLMVTERVRPFLPFPFGTIRQTAQGSVMLGRSAERIGDSLATTPAAMLEIARRNVRILPELARLRVVRQWAGLRVMAPDGYPIYEQSETHPGAFTATCHSAVTLAAAHALELAPSILEGTLHPLAATFKASRFDPVETYEMT